MTENKDKKSSSSDKTTDDNNDRVIEINSPQNARLFKNNRIITSKYTWWNFIFKNLLEQFRHVSNIYFLSVLIINVLFDSFFLSMYAVIFKNIYI